MKRYLILIACAFPAAAMAATQHSTQYYLTHPNARATLEMHCYPGSQSSVTAANCRNAWTAGKQIVQSVVKAPQHISGWGSVEQMASAGKPIYPSAPEEQTNNPAYWRIRGQAKAKAFLTNWASCPAKPTPLLANQCEAAREALAAPWRPTRSGHQ